MAPLAFFRIWLLEGEANISFKFGHHKKTKLPCLLKKKQNYFWLRLSLPLNLVTSFIESQSHLIMNNDIIGWTKRSTSAYSYDPFNDILLWITILLDGPTDQHQHKVMILLTVYDSIAQIGMSIFDLRLHSLQFKLDNFNKNSCMQFSNYFSTHPSSQFHF